MSLFNNALSQLMHHRVTWLNKRSEILTYNIAAADIPGTKRKEVRGFTDVLARKGILRPGGELKRTEILHVDQEDILQTKAEVNREVEMLEMSHNTLEHDALLSIIRNFHRMLRVLSGKQQ